MHPKNILHLAYLLLLVSCSSQNKNEQDQLPPPNIVWITSEDNSKHYLKLFDENGVPTPNIESLAEQGLIFTNAFSNAPVCSVARSSLISGCYSPRIGAQFHRKYVPVPMPDSLKMFPSYLRKAGYYTTNNNKKDYNIVESENLWNESSKEATWRKRVKGQPFFHVSNISVSHEYSLHFKKGYMDSVQTMTDLASFKVQPNHPDTKTFRYTNARYRDRIIEMDRQVGEILGELRADSLIENTFIFYFGDHGGVLPASKGYLYETGLHVPLVVYVPEKYRHLANVGENGKVQGFVSFVDLAPTVLNLAGVQIPNSIDGTAFLGADISKETISKRDWAFSYADRFDEKYDLVRAIRKGKYKYIRNFQPFNFDGLMNNYRYKQLAYQEWQALYAKGELNEVQSAFFRTRVPELLFDIESDPFETVNLAADVALEPILLQMRSELDTWIKDMPDLSFYPEHFLIDSAFSNPTDFGKNYQKKIAEYVDIANLSLSNFDTVKNQLIAHLNSDDKWKRYWALITCTTFKREAKSFTPLISKIAETDPELINRVRASEYLAIVNQISPVQSMIKCLYSSQKPSEALLILNSITLMSSVDLGYQFEIELEHISETVRGDGQVKRRLEYLGVI